MEQGNLPEKMIWLGLGPAFKNPKRTLVLLLAAFFAVLAAGEMIGMRGGGEAAPVPETALPEEKDRPLFDLPPVIDTGPLDLTPRPPPVL